VAFSGQDAKTTQAENDRRRRAGSTTDFLIERRSSVTGEERQCALNCTKQISIDSPHPDWLGIAQAEDRLPE
jgi:hypothetical protein